MGRQGPRHLSPGGWPPAPPFPSTLLPTRVGKSSRTHFPFLSESAPTPSSRLSFSEGAVSAQRLQGRGAQVRGPAAPATGDLWAAQQLALCTEPRGPSPPRRPGAQHPDFRLPAPLPGAFACWGRGFLSRALERPSRASYGRGDEALGSPQRPRRRGSRRLVGSGSCPRVSGPLFPSSLRDLVSALCSPTVSSMPTAHGPRPLPGGPQGQRPVEQVPGPGKAALSLPCEPRLQPPSRLCSGHSCSDCSTASTALPPAPPSTPRPHSVPQWPGSHRAHDRLPTGTPGSSLQRTSCWTWDLGLPPPALPRQLRV